MKQMVAGLGAVMLAASSIVAQQPLPHELTGGGAVTVRRDGNNLLVTVKGPRAGLASLCLGDDSRVRILHASAAIAEATYEKSGSQWTLSSGFGQFALRDNAASPPTEVSRRAYFDDKGWVANADNAGTAPREFTIRVDPRAKYLGVTFYTTSGTEAVSYWPATISDDCLAVKVAQGFLPATAQFRPETWYPVR